MADEPRYTTADEPREAHAAGDDAQPILVLSKCLIRPYLPSDAAVLQPQVDNPEVVRYMRSTFPSPYTMADAERWVQKATTPDPEGRQPALMNYAVCTPDGVVCGGIGLKRLADIEEARTLEVGYWVAQEQWNKGITTQALTGFTRWTFGNFPLVRRVEACVWEGNRASERVLRKAGFVWEGLRRKAVHNRVGENLDCIIYGMLREECKGRDAIDA